LNFSRITARRLVDDVCAADLPLQSREGFVRQVLGWREYMHHLHVVTDGFRALEGVPRAPRGDGGYARWAHKPWPAALPIIDASDDDAAAPSHFGAA
jgi:deoxyribodipyrimidine photolyase-related protein